MYDVMPVKRYEKTLQFLTASISPPAKVLDLGVDNPFSAIMRDHNYEVTNTQGEDLDLDTTAVEKPGYDVVTAFEILEHMVSPMNVLSAIQAPKLVATIPMRLWFRPAYRSKTDPWDRHYHEFEDWQFDWLLEKSGWKVVRREKWISPPKSHLGIRPWLNYLVPRYYAVEAVKATN